jgi:SMI1 / KNR4 family (SUKH-1)
MYRIAAGRLLRAMRIQIVWEALRKSWSRDLPVDDEGAFDSVEEALGQSLPADYKWFLMESNGGETLSPLPRLRLYSLQELLVRRTDGQPPGVLEIATNDSEGYAFDLTVNRDTARYPIVNYPLGDLDRTEVEVSSIDFTDFLRSIGQGREP